MAFAVTGFNAVAQNYISKQVASNFYSKAPFLAILGALTIGNQKKNSLQIGRPNSAEILSGKNISIGERKKLEGINEYVARVQGFKTNNTAARTTTGRVSAPTVASPTTASHGQATQYGAKFKWTHIDTPILIWHEDKIRAGQLNSREGQGIAMSQLIDEATEVGLQDHIDWVADKIWNGVPASQSTDLWSEPEGIIEALKANNTYAQVDRTVETLWQSQVDSTLKTVDIRTIIDDANLTKSLRVKGNGCNLILTNTTLYQSFKAQIVAAGGAILKDGIQEMASMGVKKELLQIDNAYVMYDPSCPANTVCAFDMSTWKFITHPNFNFTVSKFTDLSEATEGAKFADQAFVRTRFMLTCDNPFLNVRYSAIGT